MNGSFKAQPSHGICRCRLSVYKTCAMLWMSLFWRLHVPRHRMGKRNAVVGDSIGNHSFKFAGLDGSALFPGRANYFEAQWLPRKNGAARSGWLCPKSGSGQLLGSPLASEKNDAAHILPRASTPPATLLPTLGEGGGGAGEGNYTSTHTMYSDYMQSCAFTSAMVNMISHPFSRARSRLST